MCGMDAKFPAVFHLSSDTKSDFHENLPIQSHDKCRSAAFSFIVNQKELEMQRNKSCSFECHFSSHSVQLLKLFLSQETV